MKRTTSVILAILLLISASGCTQGGGEVVGNKGISTYIKEVGYAAMYEPNIAQKDYPYAYEVEFSDESGKAVENLANAQFVYLPQEELPKCDISMLEVFRIEGGELVKAESRYLYDRFMMEIKTDKGGVFVVKPSEATAQPTTSGELKYLNILIAKGLTNKEDSGKSITKKDFVNILKGALGPSANVVDYGSVGGKTITRIQAAELLSNVLITVYGVSVPSDVSDFAAKDKEQIKEDKLAFAKLTSNRNIIMPKLGKFLPDEAVSKALAAENGVISFPSVVRSKKSDTFKVTANGVPVYVQKLHDESMARFIAEGKTTIEIECSDDIKGAIVSPRVHGIVPAYSENKLTFTIDGPHQLMVQFGNMERLLLFVEAPETDVPDKNSGDVINVLDLGADPTGETRSTEIIQGAIDEASKTGKTVYVPNGTYSIKNLSIKSNVSLYLEPSAMLYSTATVEEKAGNIIRVFDAKNVKIYGYGILNHNGTDVQHPTRPEIAYKSGDGFVIRDSENVTVKGVYSLDSARWNTLAIRSKNILIDNEKVINNLNYVFTDGIDNEWSRDMIVQNSFIYCNDDAMCTKSWSKYYISDDYITENVLYKNNTAFTFASAMVLGTFMEALETRNVRYENNLIISADRGIQVRNHRSSYVHDISWADNIIERISSKSQESGGQSILINIENHEEEGDEFVRPCDKARMENLTILNLRVLADSKNPSAFDAENDVKTVKNFVIEGLVVGGEKITKDSFRANIGENCEVIIK